MTILLSTLVTVVSGFILNWLFLPAWNIHSGGFWLYWLVLLLIFAGTAMGIEMAKDEYKMKVSAIAGILAAVELLAYIVSGLSGWVAFNASSYAQLQPVETGVWNEDMPAVESVTNIALMDTDTAKVFGERALGELSDLVSQYDLSSDYTQVNIAGAPMKISILKYESFWKWNKNKNNGVPGYVIVDPINSTAQYIPFKEAVMYSPSEFFGRDLQRHLRSQFPSEMFYRTYFEVDDNGNPYWITSVYKTTIGMFGGKTITDVIITDAVTGKSEKMSTDKAPKWIDVIFDGDYICQRYNWYGLYQNGFWNSLFAGTGCTKCTADFGYLTDENDILVYTGITSIAGDSSNIGVILANERTGEIRYYKVAGADENSAMAAAQGEVQQYGYQASFPSIINVNGEPTYIMVLKDDNNIVKMYAMVNVKNYSKVVVAESQEEVFAAYAKKMGFSVEAPAVEPEEEIGNLIDVSFVVNEIQFIVNGGNTTVYITAEDGQMYKCNFDEFWLLAKESDVISAKYAEKFANDDIILLNSYTK